MEFVMTSLAHPAPSRRRSDTIPVFRRLWTAVQAAVSRAFYRIANAIYVSRSKRAQRDIAQAFADRGMPLTDAAEREIAARFMNGDWNVRR
jgi:hypothetical protein